MIDPLPASAPFTPAPWWKCLFNRWEEPVFVDMAPYQYRRTLDGYPVSDWTRASCPVYKQRHRRTGAWRYMARGNRVHGTAEIDGGAWEHSKTLIFL